MAQDSTVAGLPRQSSAAWPSSVRQAAERVRVAEAPQALQPLSSQVRAWQGLELHTRWGAGRGRPAQALSATGSASATQVTGRSWLPPPQAAEQGPHSPADQWAPRQDGCSAEQVARE